jgi:hypothetical protein
MERLNEHISSANAAVAVGDVPAAMHSVLAIVVNFPDKNNQGRYDILQAFGFKAHFEGYKLTEQTISLLEERFLNNEEEPTLYRAHAACYLAHYSLHQTSTDGIVYFKRILKLCDGASSLERGTTVSRRDDRSAEYSRCSVGDILDSFRGLSLEAIELRLQSTGLQRELEFEVFQRKIMAIQGPNGRVIKRTTPLPPTITSAVIEQVKALPENDVTFLILPDAGVYTHPLVRLRNTASARSQSTLRNFILEKRHRFSIRYRYFHVTRNRVDKRIPCQLSSLLA